MKINKNAFEDCLLKTNLKDETERLDHFSSNFNKFKQVEAILYIIMTKVHYRLIIPVEIHVIRRQLSSLHCSNERLYIK